jgi:SAM-dependent MidA family methyltransferase
MKAVHDTIRARIRREGPISFRDFMEMALYEPALGYYTSPESEIGRTGDYYTSPHLHPLFGAMLGKQIEEMWRLLGGPPAFDVIEMGAGRGHLALDMMEYLDGREIHPALSYTIVEKNPAFEARQRELLGEHSRGMRWVSSLSEVSPVRGCLLTNEVLDALPVHLVEMRDGLREVFVTLAKDEFEEALLSPSTGEIGEYLDEYAGELPEGYRTEVNLDARDWLREVSGVIEEGFLLTIDYGFPARDYYSEERTRGTLLCYHRHQMRENPYRNVGEQDITAHVNFSFLKKEGERLGLRTLGFARQGTYLVSLGIDEMMAAREKSRDPFDTAKIRGLLMPGTMGETHKVMVQYRGESPPELRGFRLKNEAHTL